MTCCTTSNSSIATNAKYHNYHQIGWYEVSETPENKIIGRVLFKPSDFSDLIIDTVPEYGLSYIQGRIVENKRNEWENMTERLIGKHLGFVYNDSVITAPVINA